MHVELLQILVAGGLTRNSYNAEASLIIVRLVVLVLLSQDTQCSFSINESLKEGLILLAILMVEKLVVLWVGKARLVGSGHVVGEISAKSFDLNFILIIFWKQNNDLLRRTIINSTK